MSNASYLGTTIDNPPGIKPEQCESNVGRAVSHILAGRRIPYDLAQALMEDGFDVPALIASNSRSAA